MFEESLVSVQTYLWQRQRRVLRTPPHSDVVKSECHKYGIAAQLVASRIGARAVSSDAGLACMGLTGECPAGFLDMAAGLFLCAEK